MNYLNNMKPEKEFIDGIYNYCDKWCEKCNFSHRCFVYYKEKEDNLSFETDEHVWEKISEELNETIGMLKEIIEEEGFDIEFDNDDIDEQIIEYHEIVALSEKYYLDVNKIFEKLKDILSNRQDILNKQIDLGIDISKFEEIYDIIDESFEIISFYQFFINIKIKRAFEEKNYFTDIKELNLHHYNGTAKTAIISIEKTIEAWSKILIHVPELQDEIIDVLALLQKIRKELEFEFPDSMAFIRPGFDEILYEKD